MNIPPLSFRWIALALIVPAGLLALAACGGDDDGGGEFQPGRLTDPGAVPTATPWPAPPEVVLLDPDNINPLPPDNPNTTEPSPTTEPDGGEPGVCGETYTVVAGDTAFAIGEKCGWPAEELDNFVTMLEELNPGVDARSLSIGQVLVMPALDADSAGDGTQE